MRNYFHRSHDYNVCVVVLARCPQLRGIAGAKTVSAAQNADLRQALQTARYASWTLHLASLQVQERLAKYRIRLEVPDNGSRSVCIPMNTSFPDGLRLSGMSDVGEPR